MKKTIKKLVAIIMIATLTIGMVGCDDEPDTFSIFNLDIYESTKNINYLAAARSQQATEILLRQFEDGILLPDKENISVVVKVMGMQYYGVLFNSYSDILDDMLELGYISKASELSVETLLEFYKEELRPYRGDYLDGYKYRIGDPHRTVNLTLLELVSGCKYNDIATDAMGIMNDIQYLINNGAIYKLTAEDIYGNTIQLSELLAPSVNKNRPNYKGFVTFSLEELKELVNYGDTTYYLLSTMGLEYGYSEDEYIFKNRMSDIIQEGIQDGLNNYSDFDMWN